jgi:hypothetical protein
MRYFIPRHLDTICNYRENQPEELLQGFMVKKKLPEFIRELQFYQGLKNIRLPAR